MSTKGRSSLATLARAVEGISRAEDFEATMAAVRIYNEASAEVEAAHAAGRRCYQDLCYECADRGLT